MDTRAKILNAGQARDILRRNGLRIAVVSGHFDPLLAAHPERLEQVRETADALLVVVTDPPRPILGARGRAELVAGLKAVDYVVAAQDDPEASALVAAAIHEEQADAQRLAELIGRVQARQAAGI